MADKDPGAVAAPEPTPAPAPPPQQSGNGRRGASRDPRVFVLLRELSEVHLLLDHVSANPNTTVSELTAGTLPAELGEDWIEKVCRIAWPPDGSEDEKAEDAALLIRAKDYLNRLAHPASGSTIAFTLLVTQQAARRRRATKGERARQQGGDPVKSWWRKLGLREDPSPTRSSLAQAAYPDLVPKALGFRRWMTMISIGLLMTLVLTCGMSWYVAAGNSALADLAATRTALNEVRNRINEAEAAEATPAAAPVASPPAAPAAGQAPTDQVTTAVQAQQPFVELCRRPIVSATQAQLCTARMTAETDFIRAGARLHAWDCGRPFTDCVDVAKAADAPSRAAAFVNIMASAVLPFFYGLLGAGAAIIRSLSSKIRSSLLSPRDLHLSIQQLALGAVVGACIGLFVASPGGGSGESLLGPITLSASAISFVAGFGVEAVFQALEALISRIFNLAPARPPAGG